MVRIIVKVFRVFPPAVADKLVGTSPLQCLEPYGKVVGLYEGFKVLAQLCVCLVEVAGSPSHPEGWKSFREALTIHQVAGTGSK